MRTFTILAAEFKLINMRKILFLVIASISFNYSTAQVNNLQDLLELSELSVYGLTEYLQSSWTISRPNQMFIDNKTKVIERYTYVYNHDGRDQILARSITVGQNDDFRLEATDFVSNEKELLLRIKKNLPYQGYELTNKGRVQIYNNGNQTISIQEGATEERLLAKGYYSILIY